MKDECVGFYGGIRVIEDNVLRTQNSYGYDDRYLMRNAGQTADGVHYALDARFECSLLRAVNNSCSPNCRVYAWYVFVLCAPIVFCVCFVYIICLFGGDVFGGVFGGGDDAAVGCVCGEVAVFCAVLDVNESDDDGYTVDGGG